MQETVASALAELARLDPKAARVAENALTTLTSGRGLEPLSQLAVQEFCWYVLPVRFAATRSEYESVAHALGRLFSLLDLDRYADVCASATTREVLSAYATSHENGVACYEKRMRASGVQPPDLPELTWGTALGTAEIEAYNATSAALEIAIAVGEIRPGTRGWRATQEQHTRGFLTQPDIQGRSRLEKIRDERVKGWLSSPSHPHRQELWPLRGQIIAGAGTPRDADGALAPIRRLLDYANDGIGLTQIGYISPTIVRELCAEFGWTETPPRSETDVLQLIALHKLLRSMRAVRRVGRRMILTRRGRQLRENTDDLWRAVAEGVLSTDGFEQAAIETLLGLLLSRSPSGAMESRRGRSAIAEEASGILLNCGWRRVSSGKRNGKDDSDEESDDATARSVLLNATWLLETLQFVTSGEESSDNCHLTTAGRAFALTAIHLSATSPGASI